MGFKKLSHDDAAKAGLLAATKQATNTDVKDSFKPLAEYLKAESANMEPGDVIQIDLDENKLLNASGERIKSGTLANGNAARPIMPFIAGMVANKFSKISGVNDAGIVLDKWNLFVHQVPGKNMLTLTVAAQPEAKESTQ